MSDETGKIDYHAGFYAAIRGEYRRASAGFEFFHEQELGSAPVRMDMLLIKRGDGGELTDAIGRAFRMFNVLEYKSPATARMA